MILFAVSSGCRWCQAPVWAGFWHFLFGLVWEGLEECVISREARVGREAWSTAVEEGSIASGTVVF